MYMNRYTTVSESVLRDLMTAKSKLTDVEMYVDQNQNYLAEVRVLGPLRRILDSIRYDEDEVRGEL